MGRFVGVDFGLKRIGLAISDPSGKLATPLCTVEGGVQAVCIALEARKKEIDALVVGLPLLLNGQEGDMAKAALQFGEKLKTAFGKPVYFVDERMTSKAMERGLSEMNL